MSIISIASLAAAASLCLAPVSGAGTWEAPEEDATELYISGELTETFGLIREENGRLLVPLRAVSDALGAYEVRWDPEDDSATVLSNHLELYVPFGGTYLTANGRCLYTWEPIGLEEDRCMVPLDELLLAFGGEYEYDPDLRRVDVTPTHCAIEPGESFYDEEDLYWLARIIHAEAGGEPFAGKIAVGNVVLNRAADSGFPDTVKEVIFDRRYGVQFTPAYSGSINNTPSADDIAAAKIALEGVMVVEGGLYFTPVRAAGHCWASRHCQVLAEIGGHVFFG